MSENNAPQVENIEALFVQSAHGLTTSKGSVTFHGLAHATLFFADVDILAIQNESFVVR